MERTEFLTKCQRAAQAPCGIKNIKTVSNDEVVRFNDVEYYGIGYQMTFGKDGSVEHTAMLHDLKADAIIYADLDSVT